MAGGWLSSSTPLLHRVMDQRFTNPKAVPEFLSDSAVSRTVEHGLERVLVLPLSRDHWDWRPESRLLVEAAVTRNNTSTYQSALGAIRAL